MYPELFPQGMAAVVSSRGFDRDPPCAGRQTQVREEIQGLGAALERLEALACKLQPVIPPQETNGKGHGEPRAPAPALAPLAEELRGMRFRAMNLVSLLERVEL